MSNSIYYNSIASAKPPQPTAYNYHRHTHRHHQHSSHHSSPVPQIQNTSSFSNHLLNNNNNNISDNNNNNNHHHHHHHSIQSHQTIISTSSLASNYSSAYFLDRTDLENYSTNTLQQTVESVISTTQSKGLKVKLSLPDDGLIINNITDPNQSWILKKSELLYFWRDPYYLNVIVVVTRNRSRNYSDRPYSASIFRLRGTDSTQLFLQQAQYFFANLSTSASISNTLKSNRNKSVDKSNRTIDQKSLLSTKSKSKPSLNINEKSSSTKKTNNNNNNRDSSPQTTTTTAATTTTAGVIRRVTRAEFDPGKATVNSIVKNSNNRTFSETASSTDSQTTSVTREVLVYTEKVNDDGNDDDNDDDDKMATITNNLTSEQIIELMRELKQLRNEIASLKLEKRIPTSMRSMSTSPLTVDSEPVKQRADSSTTTSPTFTEVTSQSEVDAETQTDFSLIQNKRRQISKKNKNTMIGSSSISTVAKKKVEHSKPMRNGRTSSSSSASTTSDQEGTSVESSSQVDTSSNDTNSSLTQELYQPPPVIVAPPRPVLVRNQNSIYPPRNNSIPYSISNGNHTVSNFNTTEEGSLSLVVSTIREKEMPKFLSTNLPSSMSEMMRPPAPTITTATANFQSSSENSTPPVEHIYENIPIIIQPTSNRDSYLNIPIINVDEQQQQQQQSQIEQQNSSNDNVYYAVNNERELETQQQYPTLGPATSNSNSTTDSNSTENQIPLANILQQKPQIISVGRHRNQPIFFANHLTNPVFNIDKQLLINTVANQFGVDLNSPQLQQLVTNQHLFAARKRTFANMVWQLTPDEETALCSPNTTTQTNIIDIETLDSDNTSGRSILKANNGFQSITKRRNISWDTTLG